MTRYIEGVSTRKVKHITEELCGISFSKSHISELNKGLDEEIILWRNHHLEKEYPYLIVDARYEKVRIGKQVLSQGVLIITGNRRRRLARDSHCGHCPDRDRRVLEQSIPRC